MSARVQLQNWLHERWYRRSGGASLLSRLDAVINENLRVKRERLVQVQRNQHPPVIVVGNLVVGGGGKSPTVIQLAREFAQLGKSVAVITGGYGGSATHAREVTAQDDPKIHSDESVMLAKRGVRVFAGRRRTQAYSLAVAKCNPDLVICDDGLQHFELPRAVQIACIDERLFGNARPLPFGPLREPLAVLQQLDAVILPQELTLDLLAPWETHLEKVPRFTACTKAISLRQIGISSTTTQKREFDLTDDNQTQAATEQLLQSHTALTHTAIDLIAGIANPAAFENLVNRVFPSVRTNSVKLADHEYPTNAVIEQYRHRTVIMTEKDAVKWLAAVQAMAIEPPHWWVLQIERQIKPDLAPFILEQLA